MSSSTLSYSVDFEALEDRLLFSATPAVAIDVPPDAQIGEEVTVKVTFDNLSDSDTGYGPFIDVFFDKTGADGAGPEVNDGNPATTNPGTDDGISLIGAPQYLGLTLNHQVLTLDDTANDGRGILHPYAVGTDGNPVYISTSDPTSPYYSALNGHYQNGDQLLVIELPFGSFTPGQPQAEITFRMEVSELADVGYSIHMTALGGFRFGEDPLNNPASDPSIIGVADMASTTVDATLAHLTKIYLGPENETATGPNFVQTYRINIDIASGQTLTDLNIFDLLPGQTQFVGVSGSSHAYSIINTPSTTNPGGEFHIVFTDAITGDPSNRTNDASGHYQGDAWIDIEFYVPRLDAANAVVNPAVNGDDHFIDNQAYGYGNWDPLDTRDAAIRVGLEATVNPNLAGAPNAVPDADPEHYDLEAQSIAIQKHYENITRPAASYGEIRPGDELEYSLDFQISDYFAFGGIVITDILSDGLEFNPANVTLTLNGNTYELDTTLVEGVDYILTANADGTTTVVFNVSSILGDRAATPGSLVFDTANFNADQRAADLAYAQDGKLLGGGVNPFALDRIGEIANNLAAGLGAGATYVGYNAGATRGTITYRATVLDKFRVDYPSGEASLNPRDQLNNTVDVRGDVLNLNDADLSNTGFSEDDDSGVGLQVEDDVVRKEIYAINGSTDLTPYTDSNGNINLQPGDSVTYRILYTMPTGDVEQLRFTDFLPLPIFKVGDPNADGTTGGLGEWSFSDTQSGIPGVGQVIYGPGHTLDQATTAPSSQVTLSIDSVTNSIRFGIGSSVNTTNQSLQVDLLFTVTVNSDPFADGMYLTNQVQSGEQNTQNPGFENEATTNAIVQIVLNEPVVDIYKGVVASSQGGSVGTVGGITFAGTSGAGFSGTLSGAANAAAIGALDLTTGALPDAGDTIRFAIVAQNTGRSDAFDVELSDTIRGSYVNNYVDVDAFRTGTNFEVYRGDGTALTYGVDYTLSWNAGTQTFSVELTDNYVADNEAGDTKSGGLSRGYNAGLGSDITNGSNAIVVLYDLTVAVGAQASSTILNTASLTNYAGAEGATDHTTQDKTESASVRISTPDIDKVVTDTEFNGTGNDDTQAVIGEWVDYTITLTITEGHTIDAVLRDVLNSGMAFVEFTSLSISDGISFTINGTNFNSTSDIATLTGLGFGSGVDVGSDGRTFTIDFGDITNTENDAAVETITISYRAVVLNVAGNVDGANSVNTASFSYNWTNDTGAAVPTTGTNTLVDTATVGIVAPQITIDKTASNSSAGPWVENQTGLDAGDTGFYKIVIRNAAGNPTAYDITFNDPLPANFIANAIASVVGTGNATGLTAANFSIAGNVLTLTLAGLDLAAGDEITLVVQGTIDNDVVPAEVLNNTANVGWTSIDGGTPSEVSTHNSANPTQNTEGAYTDSDAASITVAPIMPVKSIVGTSESSTTGNNLTVGEIVRYRLVIQLPESTITDLQFRDNLPPGLQFLNDDTTTIAFISDNGITSSVFGTLPGITGSSVTTPTFIVLATSYDGAISSSSTLDVDTYNAGTDIYFKLGNITNLDNDANAEYIVIEFNAIVTNAPGSSNNAANSSGGSDSGDTNRNNFTVRFDGQDRATSNNVDVTIVEPVLGIVNNISNTTGDAGDLVNITMTVSNTGNATAFDNVVTNTLDPSKYDLSTLNFGVAGTDYPAGYTPAVDLVTGTITWTGGNLAAGGVQTFGFSVSLTQDVEAGEQLTSSASVTYTSLPGEGSTGAWTGNAATSSVAPGDSGTVNGERDGSGTAPNDYFASASDSFVLATPTITKTFVSTSDANTGTSQHDGTRPDLAIGETVTYDIVVTFTEGLTNGITIFDLGQDNANGVLEILSAQVISVGGNLSATGGSSAMVVGTNGVLSSAIGSSFAERAAFNFGTVNNAFDNAATSADQIVIRVVARAANTVANQGGDTLTNQGSLVYTDGQNASQTVNTAPVTIDVVEPRVTVTQSVVTATNGLDAGDNVTYRVTINNLAANGATAPAYDVALSNLLPPGMVITSIGAPTLTGGATVDTALSGVGGTTLTGVFDLLVGGSVTFEFTATIPDTVTPGQVLNSDINVTFSSQDGAVAGERTGADVTDPESNTPPTNDSVLNNYAVGADTNVTAINPLGITKALIDTSHNGDTSTNVVIGEVLTYQLTVTVMEGTTNNLSIIDNLPPGLVFLANSAQISANGMTITGFNNDSASQLLTVVNPGNSNAPGTADTDTFTITYQVLVVDIASNQAGTDLVNDVDATATGTPPDLNNQVTVTVTEPDLVLTKSNDDADNIITRGQTVEYTVSVTNAQSATGATAYDVVITDRIQTGVLSDLSNIVVALYDMEGTASTGDDTLISTLTLGVDYTLTASTTGWTVTLTAGLEQDQRVSVSYTATFSTALSDGATIDNNARVVYSSLSGAVAEERIYSPDAADEVHDQNTDSRQDTERVTVGSGSISDFVWFDANADGLQTAGEVGISGVRVWIDMDGDNTFNSSTDLWAVTDSNGLYEISGLAPGGYKVNVDSTTLPTDAVPTFDLDGVATANVVNNVTVTTLVSATGDAITNVDFGYRGTGSIGDLVWLDLDASGAQNGLEPGIGGVTLDLIWDANGNGIIDAGDSVIATTTTLADGSYLFGNLFTGNYIVNVTDVAGVLANATLTGAAGVTDPEAVALTSVGQNYLDADFGYRGAASIGDRVWNDHNGDGVQDAGEFGISGLTVNLYRDVDGNGEYDPLVDLLIASTTTAANGEYDFLGLIADDYLVEVVNSLASTSPTYDLDGIVTTPNIAGRTLGSNEQADDVDFGYRGSASIGDYVWFDQNGDGVQDAGEPPLSGVRVFLDIDGDGVYTAGVDTVRTTGPLGQYVFDGLIAGTYTVIVDPATLPPGLRAPTWDRDDLLTTPNGVAVVTVGATTIVTDADFGFRGEYVISGVSYHDQNKDGSQNGTDTGIGGSTIELIWDTNNNGVFDAGDYIVTSTITAADGSYTFEDLIVGNYLVRETQPAGFGAGSENGSNLIDVTVADGIDNSSRNFGNTTGSLSGTVFRDDNNDGVQNGTEIGLAGVDVTLDWSGADGVFGTADDRTVTIQTDANGNYTFDYTNTSGFLSGFGDSISGLLSTGEYRVREAQPTGYLDGADAVGNAAVATGAVTGASVGRTTGDALTGVRIGAGQDATGYTFGELLPASLSGHSYVDLNGNGAFDLWESGLAGVTITLTGVNDIGTIINVSVTTDANGFYSFENLRPGEYHLTQTQPTGYLDGGETLGTGLSGTNSAGNTATNDLFSTIRFVTVEAGNNVGQNYNFGEVFDFDLIKSIVSTNVAGTTGSNVAIGEVVRYQLQVNIPYGELADFQIEDILPPGLRFLNDGTASYILSTGLSATGVSGSTGLLGDTAISSDALLNDDTYASGTNVFFKFGTVTNAGPGNGAEYITIEFNAVVVNEAGNAAIPSTALDNDFTVRFDHSGDGTSDSVVVTSNTVTVSVVEPVLTVTKTENDADDIVSVGQTITYTIRIEHDASSNSVAYDLVLNDVIPPSLTYLGATVTSVPAYVVGYTDNSSGNTLNFTFSELRTGDYIEITYTAIVNKVAPATSIVNDVDLDWNSTPGTNADERASTTSDSNTLAVGTGTVSDTVWYDVNGDGVFGSGEVGIPGVRVWADLNNDGIYNETEPTAITDGLGRYLIEGLAPGDFTIRVAGPNLAGMVGTHLFDDADVPGVPVAGSNAAVVRLSDGENETRADFGFRGIGSLGDTVFNDINGNGVQDGKDKGIPNVGVNVTWAGFDGNFGTYDDVVFQVVTDSNGQYLISNLPPGMYRVDLVASTLPSGYKPTFDLDGIGTPHSSVFNLGIGANRFDADFGYTNPALNAAKGPAGLFGVSYSALSTYFMTTYDPTFDPWILPAWVLLDYTPIFSSPMLTGHAEPGSKIVLSLYNHRGEFISTSTVLVASGGNWSAGFADVSVNGPITIVSSVAANDFTAFSSDDNFNYRTNYITGMAGGYFQSRTFGVEGAFSNLSYERLEAMESEEPNFGWVKNDYEFLAEPALPGN